MHGTNVLNDTGSTLLTLFYADLQYLENYPLYQGWQQALLRPLSSFGINQVYTTSIPNPS